ncbi:hypothetical protein Tco_1150228 [Tanacetum coccineum]
MSTDKESSAAGTDNRPPMLVESDYESWKIRIERYIREGQGDDAVQVTRDKQDEEFNEIENNKELADIQATNIISQVLGKFPDFPNTSSVLVWCVWDESKKRKRRESCSLMT